MQPEPTRDRMKGMSRSLEPILPSCPSKGLVTGVEPASCPLAIPKKILWNNVNNAIILSSKQAVLSTI